MAGGIEWFRWHHGSVTDPKFLLVARKAGVSLPDVLAVWVFILEKASAADQRGLIGELDTDAIDCLFGFDDGATASIVKHMEERSLIGGGAIASWEKRQPKREDDTSAERKRRQREREHELSMSQKQGVTEQPARNVTQGHAHVTQCHDREEESREEIEIPSLSSVAPMPQNDQAKPKREKPESHAIPACPHESLIDLFAARLPELPQPVKSLWADGKNGASTKSRWAWVLTACHEHGERKGQRLAQTTEEALAWFDRFFRYVAKSDFLTGREGEWMSDMGWLMTKSNFEKVISGNYENKAKAA